MPEENEWDCAKDLIKCECGHTPSLYRKNDWFRVVCDYCSACSNRFVEAKVAVQDWNRLKQTRGSIGQCRHSEKDLKEMCFQLLKNHNFSNPSGMFDEQLMLGAAILALDAIHEAALAKDTNQSKVGIGNMTIGNCIAQESLVDIVGNKR